MIVLARWAMVRISPGALVKYRHPRPVANEIDSLIPLTAAILGYCQKSLTATGRIYYIARCNQLPSCHQQGNGMPLREDRSGRPSRQGSSGRMPRERCREAMIGARPYEVGLSLFTARRSSLTTSLVFPGYRARETLRSCVPLLGFAKKNASPRTCPGPWSGLFRSAPRDAAIFQCTSVSYKRL